MADGARTLAVFFDFENVGLSFHGRERFDIDRVLERLVEKGKIVAKKAYADWNRFSHYTASLHESAIELIEIPRRAMTGKNSADIRLCVDAMDLAYSKDHIDTFVVVSGDSDFSPLVSKLKELGKHVIGLGMQSSTSELLRDNCDEFIYYEDLGRIEESEIDIDPRLPEAKRKVFALLLESCIALRRENKDVLWSSMVKDTMKRKKPSFNETYYGYRAFSDLLQDAADNGVIEIEIDKRSRTFTVTRIGEEVRPLPPGAPPRRDFPPPPQHQRRELPPRRYEAVPPPPPPPPPAPPPPPPAPPPPPPAPPPVPVVEATPPPPPAPTVEVPVAPPKRRRRRGGKADAAPVVEAAPVEAPQPAPEPKAKPAAKPRSRGGRKPKVEAVAPPVPLPPKSAGFGAGLIDDPAAPPPPPKPAPKPAVPKAPPARKPELPRSAGFGAGILE